MVPIEIAALILLAGVVVLVLAFLAKMLGLVLLVVAALVLAGLVSVAVFTSWL
jgi:hypothetical protein